MIFLRVDIVIFRVEVIFMFTRIREDIAAVRQRDPAARSGFEIVLMYAGVHALFWHRPAHWLYRHHCFFLARLISQLTRFFTGIEIHPGAVIGHSVFIDHGSGIVIGETAEVGDGCTLYQGVTLGGTGKDSGKRHPTLGNNVLIGAGAKVLGPVYIGDNVRVGAGSVVLKNLPANTTAVGVPAEVVRVRGSQSCPADDLDQQALPDVLSNRISTLEARLSRMEAAMQGEYPPDKPRFAAPETDGVPPQDPHTEE